MGSITWKGRGENRRNRDFFLNIFEQRWMSGWFKENWGSLEQTWWADSVDRYWPGSTLDLDRWFRSRRCRTEGREMGIGRPEQSGQRGGQPWPTARSLAAQGLRGLGTMLRHGNSTERERGTRRIHLGYQLKPKRREWAWWLGLAASDDSAMTHSR